MRITTKRLEIIFVIVYFVVAALCLLFAGKRVFLAFSAGFALALGDWYILKFMSRRWLKRKRFSLMENFVRYLVVGAGIWMLFKAGLNIIGIVLGVSVIPVSLMAVSGYGLVDKNLSVDE